MRTMANKIVSWCSAIAGICFIGTLAISGNDFKERTLAGIDRIEDQTRHIEQIKGRMNDVEGRLKTNTYQIAQNAKDNDRQDKSLQSLNNWINERLAHRETY